MKRTFIFCSLIIVFAVEALASNSDSLIYFNELNHSSITASNAFRSFISQNNDEIFNLLLKSGNEIDETKIKEAEELLKECVSDLAKKNEDKNEKETVKNITTYVQKKFLKTFNLKSNFSALFESGAYNNLSEMLLYVVVLNKMQIPFQVMENANSIHINAYPSTSKIEIKSKENEKKYFEFSDHYKKKFALSLYYIKEISRDELAKESDEYLFNKYYFSTTPITLIDIVSLYYQTKGLNLFEEKKADDAIIDIEKAYYLKANTSHTFALKYHVINSLGSNNYTNKSDVHKLIILCRLNNSKDPEVTNEFIKAEHTRLINAYTATKVESLTYEQFHMQIINSIKDKNLQKELDFNFNIGVAIMLRATKKEHELILDRMVKAYMANSESKELHSLIFEDFSNTIMKLNNPEMVLSEIAEYSKKFDFVTKTTPIMRIKANCLLDVAFIKFNKGLMEEGNDYLANSAKTYESLSIIPDEINVEKAYLEAARNYYIAGNRNKAKEYLTKGLKLAPESAKIKEKLKMVN